MTEDIKIKATVERMEFFDAVVFVWELGNTSKKPDYALVQRPPIHDDA